MTVDDLHVRDFPERIVCLVEEPTEILYALGEQERIVGISAYTVRPERAQAEKPVVSAFIGGSIDKIRALKPDFIIGFSDIQADLARDLIKHNEQVLIFNQRSLQDILDVIVSVGRLVGREQDARDLADGYIEGLRAASERTAEMSKRPRVYFEEWPDDPTITGIRWVSQLVEIAGGTDIFRDVSFGKAASERSVTHEQVIEAAPDIIIGSWCGKPVDKDDIRNRPGYEAVPAVKHDEIYEIDSSLILQPGPACLTDGLAALEDIIRSWEPGSE
jgi:iron complex transport system substrate-binding protein